ncbi:MAG: DUF4294 domain-containing protein [Bacteroidales bacterium]|nr:DUF4294 domain-containing protein [Bacteroidales bacterium]
MKGFFKYFLVTLVGLMVVGTTGLSAQIVMKGNAMEYQIDENGDTVYVDLLKAAKIYAKQPRMKGKDWRKYYKLVYNFNRSYPYALVGRDMMAQVDSTIAADELKRAKRDTYIKEVERELFRKFEGPLRKMTVSQGALIMRLVDRECGMCPYDIIKEYLNGCAAGFWQGVAKCFGSDLKRRYDPKGEDKDIEELVTIWDSGDWDAFYYSIFWEMPEKVVLDAQLNSTSPRSASKKK